MAKQDGIYVCDICGQVVKVEKSGAGTLVCCNQPMRLYKEE
jgi:superoxide reductase